MLYRWGVGWGVRTKGKREKHGKVEVKRKGWVLAQTFYSPQGNAGSHQGGNLRAIDHSTRRITEEAAIVKGLENQ